jgi:hypothetical protein
MHTHHQYRPRLQPPQVLTALPHPLRDLLAAFHPAHVHVHVIQADIAEERDVRALEQVVEGLEARGGEGVGRAVGAEVADLDAGALVGGY